MRRASFEDMNCSIAKTLEIIGEWWTPLILRDAFLGVSRFDDFCDRLGIARNVLTARLATLVQADVLERRVYDEARGRADYVLTEKGLALWPVMVTIRQWGDEWLVAAGQEPVQLLHTSCASVTDPHLVCDVCDERLERKALRAIDGPGADDESLIPTARPAGTEPARVT